MSQEVIEITEREIEVIEVVEKGPAGPIGPQANINYTVVSSPQTLSNSQNIAADTSGGSFTLTLPANPNAGDSIDIFDYSETFDTNPLTIARNGENIESIAEDLICNVEGAYFTMIYTGSTRGWQILPRYGTTGGGGESVLTTEGDMVYRGAAINERLPIGTAGQILKVNSGGNAPEWGAAPATGVTSVGVTGSDGIEVDSGSPVTGSGTIALGVNAATLRSHINVADGANNYTHPNHSGDVTSVGDGATTIANDVVTNAKLANVATSTIKGRATAGTGDPEDLTASQVRTILNVADGAEVNVQSNWTEADSGSDAFILNKPSTFTPSTHASSHATGGSDAIAPSDIGAANTSHTHAASDITSGTLTHERGGLEADVSAYDGLVKISGGSTSAVTVTTAGEALLDDADAAAQRTTLGLGTAATVSADQDLGTGDTVTFDQLTVASDTFLQGGFEFDNGVGTSYITTAATGSRSLSIPDASGTIALVGDAPASHTHGNLTNDGKIGSTAGLPIKTGTAGVVEAGAFGTGAGEFAEGNHTHADLHTRSHAITSTSDHTAGNHKVFYSDGSGQIQELALGNSGEVLTSNGASAAPSFAAASGGSGGATNLWIPASAFIPKTTAGCGVDSRETATNDQNFDELLFDAGTDEFADALVVMPSNYNNGTITARFYWTAASGSGGVAWAIQGRAFANDDALDTAAGTAQLVTDTLIAADDMHVTSATSAVTIGGTPAANTPIQFSIYRDVSDAADDLAVDARLLGVEIIFN